MFQFFLVLFFMGIGTTQPVAGMEQDNRDQKQHSSFGATFAGHEPMPPLHCTIINQDAFKLRQELNFLYKQDPACCASAINEPWQSVNAFHRACAMGDLGKVKVLIHFGADTTQLINVYDNTTDESILIDQLNALHLSASLGHRKIVKRLLSNCAINATDIKLMTPLHHALANKHKNVALLLLQSGAHTLAKDRYGSTVYDYALETGDEELIGAVCCMTDSQQVTFLHNAVRDHDYRHMCSLLAHGHSVDVQDADTLTPLHYACIIQDAEAIAILLQYDASTIIADQDDMKPIHYALNHGDSFLFAIKMLLDKSQYDDITPDLLTDLYSRKQFKTIECIALTQHPDIISSCLAHDQYSDELILFMINTVCQKSKSLVSKEDSIKQRARTFPIIHERLNSMFLDLCKMDCNVWNMDVFNAARFILACLPYKCSPDGTPVLHLFCKEVLHTDQFDEMFDRYLLFIHSCSFDLSQKDDMFGGTVLIMVVHYLGDSQYKEKAALLLKVFLDHGCPIDDQDKDGFTALDWARYYKALDSVDVLLQNGAKEH